EYAELGEMIARAARAELFPGRVLALARDARDVPVAVHHGVRLGRTMFDANAKPRAPVERFFVSIELFRERFNGLVQNRELHAASDIDTDRVGNDRIFAC